MCSDGGCLDRQGRKTGGGQDRAVPCGMSDLRLNTWDSETRPPSSLRSGPFEGALPDCKVGVQFTVRGGMQLCGGGGNLVRISNDGKIQNATGLGRE